MYDPTLLATNRRESDSPLAWPVISLAVMACANTGGSTGPAGIGFVVSTTSAECGRFASWFVNRITTVQPVGTVSVSLPSLKPLKFKPPLSGVRPDVSWNVAVLAVVSTVSQLQSIFGFAVAVCAAHSGADSKRNEATRLESFLMGPSYLATGADGKTHVNVATGSGFVEAIARRVDDHRADI